MVIIAYTVGLCVFLLPKISFNDVVHHGNKLLHTVSFNGKKYFHISVYCGNNHFHILTLKNYIGLESTVIEGMVLEGSMGRPT